jgi:hypothetical protein
LVTAKRRASTFHLSGEPPKGPKFGRILLQVVELTFVNSNRGKNTAGTTAVKKASTKIRGARRNVTAVTAPHAVRN